MVFFVKCSNPPWTNRFPPLQSHRWSRSPSRSRKLGGPVPVRYAKLLLMNQGIIRETYWNNYGHCWGILYEKVCLNIRFKSFLESICFRLVQSNTDFILNRLHYFQSPKLQIPWFLGFWTRRQAPKPTLFIFGDTRTPKPKSRRFSGTFLKHIYIYIYIMFATMGIKNFEKRKFMHHVCLFWNFKYLMRYQILWIWAPGNDEDWLNKIYKILDMNFISIKKHEMQIW